MDGDIEGLPFRHRERPRVRDMELRGSREKTYGAEDFRDVVEAFDKLKADEPETVLSAAVRVM